MSRKSHKQRLAQLRWLQILSENKEKFKDTEGMYLLTKLKKVNFTKQGEMKMDMFGIMAKQQFPSLYNPWKERMNG